VCEKTEEAKQNASHSDKKQTTTMTTTTKDNKHHPMTNTSLPVSLSLCYFSLSLLIAIA
jgi:hypothetical protein